MKLLTGSTCLAFHLNGMFGLNSATTLYLSPILGFDVGKRDVHKDFCENG